LSAACRCAPCGLKAPNRQGILHAVYEAALCRESSGMLWEFARQSAGPLVVALAATMATLATLAPDRGGPGITCDEGYRVAEGKRLVRAWRTQGLAFFRRDNIRANFPWQPDGRPVEPPLGHWILGWTHRLFDPAPDGPGFSIVAARFAPALALGALVLLVGLWTLRVEGQLAGTVAAVAVVLVPRVFAHGHLAALDMLTALFFVAAVLAVAGAARGGRVWHFALAGVVWGLAMLVRLHGVLVLPPVLLWVVWRLGRRAWLPAVAWVGAGVATLYAGWPWLWLGPVGHLRRFLGSGIERQAVKVFYLGRVWADRDVPWHYPMVMFVAVVPVGLFVLGLLGIWAKRRAWSAEPHLVLLIGTWLFMLGVFSWPGVPVYDGVRLFLMVFPLWAIWVGMGAKWLVEGSAFPSRSRRGRLWGLGVFLSFQATGLVIYHPCQLSHYSLVVGGLAGAERLGFEVSYWGDAVDEAVLERAAARSQGRPILLAPHLAPWQAATVTASSPALAHWQTQLVGWDPAKAEAAMACRYAVVYRRRANLDVIQGLLAEGRVVDEYTKQGVWLARVIELPAPFGREIHPVGRRPSDSVPANGGGGRGRRPSAVPPSTNARRGH
jgi:4-amino-4-deoxy-L-arabinose transferase-like glycosyltransferase